MAFRFTARASHASCRHASGRVLREPVRAPRTRARRRRSSNLRRHRRRLPRARKAEQGVAAPQLDAARGRSTSPAAGFHHQADAGAARPHARLHRHRGLDPAVRRQGRAAGRYRLYLLPARRRRSRKPAGDVSVQRRPGRVLGLAAVRRRRPLARCRSSGEGAVSSATPDLLPNAETWLDFTDLVFIDPVGTGYSRFVASGDDVRKRFYSVDGDVSADRAGDPALAGKIRPPAVAEIRHRRELWRHSRTEDRAQPADPAGRRRARADPGFALARLPRLFRLEPAAIHVHACRAWRRWRAKPRGR